MKTNLSIIQRYSQNRLGNSTKSTSTNSCFKQIKLCNQENPLSFGIKYKAVGKPQPNKVEKAIKSFSIRVQLAWGNFLDRLKEGPYVEEDTFLDELNEYFRNR